MIRRYLVIRHHHETSKEVHHEHHSSSLTHEPAYTGKETLKEKIKHIHETKGIPFEFFANELMEYEPFIKYLQENGSHFSNDLADYVDDTHKKGAFMSTEQVSSAMASSSLKLPKDVTLGDFTYLVNSEYHSHPDAIAKAMEKVKHQPYPGFIFNRWLADHIGMGKKIPWEIFV